jgi:hypothetical protein
MLTTEKIADLFGVILQEIGSARGQSSTFQQCATEKATRSTYLRFGDRHLWS